MNLNKIILPLLLALGAINSLQCMELAPQENQPVSFKDLPKELKIKIMSDLVNPNDIKKSVQDIQSFLRINKEFAKLNTGRNLHDPLKYIANIFTKDSVLAAALILNTKGSREFWSVPRLRQPKVNGYVYAAEVYLNHFNDYNKAFALLKKCDKQVGQDPASSALLDKIYDEGLGGYPYKTNNCLPKDGWTLNRACDLSSHSNPKVRAHAKSFITRYEIRHSNW